MAFIVSPDSVRLLVVLGFVYASVSDYNHRTVPDDVWVPFVGLAILTTGWDIGLMVTRTGFTTEYFVSLILGFITIPVLIFPLWESGFFGGADAKALGLLAILFPTPPSFHIQSVTFPLFDGMMGVFALTVLFNALVFGAVMQGNVFIRNIISKSWSWKMGHALPARVDKIDHIDGELTASNGETVPIDLVHDFAVWIGAGSIAELDKSDTSPQHIQQFYDTKTPTGNRIPSQTAFVQVLDDTIQNDRVWVIPDMPFIVFITFGLLTALSIGSLVNIIVTVVVEFTIGHSPI